MKKAFFLLSFAILTAISFAGHNYTHNTCNTEHSKNQVVLTPQRNLVHYMLGGTTRSSGRNSVLYHARETFGIQTAGDSYTFKSELCFSFAFDDDDTGRGKILNVSDYEYVVECVCYDLYGNVVSIFDVTIAPRTFSRILVNDYDGPLSKIVCRIK